MEAGPSLQGASHDVPNVLCLHERTQVIRPMRNSTSLVHLWNGSSHTQIRLLERANKCTSYA